jgi:hypothetical protein
MTTDSRLERSFEVEHLSASGINSGFSRAAPWIRPIKKQLFAARVRSPQFAFNFNRSRLLRASAQLACPSWGPMLC